MTHRWSSIQSPLVEKVDDTTATIIELASCSTIFRVCGKKFFLGTGCGEVGKWGSCLITLLPQNPITLFIS
ncbi:MAG: hypothetical protein EWV83_12865 [Microcystis sp. M_OC_Ca_00000000_S217Cul]|nr:MAG: hypothetical protein EWV83_12865 [Microcystis sp. M_OC_Ca_00000000_S217Cul]TRT88907.1 MAG: hypothetical protein EWV66_11235 [Microcystis sp. M_OC_Ca_00000000_C217Col]